MAAALFLAFMPVSCDQPEPETPQQEQETPEDETPGDEKPEEEVPQEEPAKLQAVKGSVPVSNNWIFDKKPLLELNMENPNEVATKVEVKAVFTTDKGEKVTTVTDSVAVLASSEKGHLIETDSDLTPGFYKVRISINNKTVRSFGFGVSPFEVISEPDMQDDFSTYWEDAKTQLASIDMNPVLVEIPSKSSSTRKVYFVEMQSVPNGLSGEPVIIRGFYCQPQDGKKHPVLMHYFGWDDRGGAVTVPSGGSSNYAEFYLSTRGQYHNNRAAAYEKVEAWIKEHGEWVAKDPCTYASISNPSDKYNWFGFNFGDKDSFYYRGAFMDCVQAIRFMAEQPTSDMTNLFAEGSSQGGAFTYAAAALSDYPFVAIAPNVAFLGDFPDYFDIVSWPGDVAKRNKGSMSDDEMYAFLSYFDTKNLATRISCAVHASSGLQDGTCPPHTNFAPYNNLNTTDKVMIIAPEMGHSYPSGWESSWRKFFEERMK